MEDRAGIVKTEHACGVEGDTVRRFGETRHGLKYCWIWIDDLRMLDGWFYEAVVTPLSPADALN